MRGPATVERMSSENGAQSSGVDVEQASNTARGAPGDRRSLRKFLGIASSPRGAEAAGSVMTPASRAALIPAKAGIGADGVA